MAISRARTAVIVTRNNNLTLAKRPCCDPPAKQNLRKLLEDFSYNVRMYSELEVKDLAKETFLDDCELLIFDLAHADHEKLALFYIAAYKGLPCILIGEPKPESNPMVEIMTGVLFNGLFPNGLYWFSCVESMYAALATIESLKLAIDSWRFCFKSVLKDYPHEMVEKLVTVKLENKMEQLKNVN